MLQFVCQVLCFKIIAQDIAAEKTNNPNDPRIYYEVLRIGGHRPTRISPIPLTLTEAISKMQIGKSMYTHYQIDAEIVISQSFGPSYTYIMEIHGGCMPHYHAWDALNHPLYVNNFKIHSYFSC